MLYRLRLKDVPKFPAYLVFHDAFDNGAMEVYPYNSFAAADRDAKARNTVMEESGAEEGGMWRAYAKLPRVRVWKLHKELT